MSPSACLAAATARRVEAGAAHDRGLGQVVGGQQNRGSPGGGRLDDRQHPADRPQGAVERQLAEQPGAVDAFRGEHPGGDQDAGGDGEVEQRSFLALLGRGEVDDDRSRVEVTAEMTDRGQHPLAGLAHRGVGQTDHRQRRQAGTGVHLDLHRQCLDAAGHCGTDLGNHGAPPGAEVWRVGTASR